MTMPDVIIVGGGSCGSVLAARLSENPDRRVLLLEAGPRPSGAEQQLGVLPVAAGGAAVWSYPTRLTGDRQAVLVPGRGLGGSGAVNGGYFIRAVPADLEGWGSALWTYDAALPFFRASETDLDYPDSAWHGDRGPVPVRREPGDAQTTLSRAFAQSCRQLGIPEEPDKNAAGPPGFGPVPLNARAGRGCGPGTVYLRFGPGTAYLDPALDRPNLEVRCETTVRRIVVTRGRVTGVAVSGPEGTARESLAASQVVLCAGGIGTPSLLLRSGLGPAGPLRSLGIEVVQDLPGVGRATSNHPEVLLPYRSNAPTGAGAPALQVVLNTAEGLELRPYTASFTELVPGTPSLPPQLGVALMQPNSRGTIALRSADPAVAPAIEQHYLTDRADRAALRRGVELALALFAQPGLREVAEPLEAQPDDGWITEHLGTSQHLCGGAPLGGDADPAAVVDERLRVRGIAGLSIADTSAIPLAPSRGPHATAVMLAERAATLI